jgi:site-specific recombinase XerD
VGHVRDFLLDRAHRCSAPSTQRRITSLRAFLRYLTFTGRRQDDLAVAVPAIANWRLSRQPCCLSEDEVTRLIAASDGPSPGVCATARSCFC